MNKMNTRKTVAQAPAKAPTGIDGFDEITHGGLPRARTTLLGGGPGSGKTLMALQTLVNAARRDNEPGIFVAFEESSERVIANAAQFGWDLEGLQKKKLFFLNAQPNPDMLQAGSFDLGGMLAGLGAKALEMNARRIVFDSIDVVLALLGGMEAEHRELYRLNNWILKLGLTAIITCKSGGETRRMDLGSHLGFMQFMVDCAVMLNHDLVEGVSQRSLRVVKYRGSGFSENESPFLIGSQGLEVAGI
jgi:circadian clock protein KaiC